MWPTILAVLGSFMGVFVLFKYVVFMEIRLDAKTFKALYEIIKGGRKFLINEEFITEAKYPVTYLAFCWISRCPLFFINHSERLLTAGFQGKELVTSLTCFRWRYQALKNYLGVQLKELELSMGVPVELITPNYIDRIGMLKKAISEPILDRGIWEDIAREADEVFAGKREKTGAILYGPPGNGKCLGKGTPVLMFDGRIKKVEQIVSGDLLMGPDSMPRQVLSTASGWDRLYKIIPVKGETYVVNESHILSLKMNADVGGCDNGEVVNLSVLEYLQTSNYFKHHAKGWRTGVEFPAQSTSVDPYFLGLWLGDGNATTTSVTTPDPELEVYISRIALEMGLQVGQPVVTGAARTYPITTGRGIGKPRLGRNLLLNYLRLLGIMGTGNKRIPWEYKYNSRSVRLRVLAGLIDSDGCKNCNCFDYISKDVELAKDVVYLARSLGFAAYMRPCIKCCQTGVSGEYYRVGISGDLSEVPTLLTRKRCLPRKQKKDVMVTGIEVVPHGDGEYFGFELDGDGLFLLGDFTVTHNTSFVKYLATKYRVPIKIITFSPDFTNHDLMGIFSQIGPRCIVLFEDFDNYFDGRNCILGTSNNHIKFTFDIILNGLDGVYNTYENVVFFMTVNHIEKVDPALTNRPSRFKYVRKFGNPSEELRRRMVPSVEVPEVNLDQLMRIREYIDGGLDLPSAMKNVSDIQEEDVLRQAYLDYHTKARMSDK